MDDRSFALSDLTRAAAVPRIRIQEVLRTAGIRGHRRKGRRHALPVQRRRGRDLACFAPAQTCTLAIARRLANDKLPTVLGEQPN